MLCRYSVVSNSYTMIDFTSSVWSPVKDGFELMEDFLSSMYYVSVFSPAFSSTRYSLLIRGSSYDAMSRLINEQSSSFRIVTSFLAYLSSTASLVSHTLTTNGTWSNPSFDSSWAADSSLLHAKTFEIHPKPRRAFGS